MRKYIGSIFIIICLLSFTSVAGAAQNSNAQKEQEAAWEAALNVQIAGPAKISLLDQAQIQIPEHYAFIPQPEASRVMKSMGNGDCPEMVGFIISDKENEDWIVTIDYTKSGYIKDDDAKAWDAEELLTSLKEGTKENNKERKEKGLSEMTVTGWVEKPQYDAARHYLVWSIELKTRGERERTINYNTYALGREGYLTLTLVTDLKNIGAEKSVAQNLLAATEFVPGKRYEEFNSVTDHIAEYGLAALITGVAAKKLGVLAMIAAFGAKFIKLIVIGVGALGVLVVKYFRKKKNEKDNETSGTMEE
ncbi:DUF2167 domain-containing protein [Pelosinus baikalensis]|uniref:DUF2167 domain-containing protein n=1 Tax=Pelosinus baikalensis TaxID=2892015 RepID=A0ABS8HM86_9FIRM|nr:DUF2167 domain-containing protein [Pelosinus baikalensis]